MQQKIRDTQWFVNRVAQLGGGAKEKPIFGRRTYKSATYCTARKTKGNAFLCTAHSLGLRNRVAKIAGRGATEKPAPPPPFPTAQPRKTS